MYLVLIALGSNIDPERNISAALTYLEHLTLLKDKASIWQTPAVGSEGSDYLNTAVLIETQLKQDQFKKTILSEIEDKLDRIRIPDKYADRTIDLDILVYGDQVIDHDLWLQPHVTIPAAEICPDLINPDTGESLSQAAIRFLPGINFVKRTDL